MIYQLIKHIVFFFKKDIIIKSLPDYGNLGLRKKDIKPYVENNKSSIKISD